MSFTPGQIIGGGAAVGIIAALWERVRFMLDKILAIAIVNHEISGSSLSIAIKMLLMKEFKCSPIGNKCIGGTTEYVRPVGRNLLVAMEKMPSDPTLYWRKGRCIMASCSDDHIKIQFIRGTFDKDSLIVEAIDKYNSENHERNWRSYDRFSIQRKTGSIGAGHNERLRYNGGNQTEAPSISPEGPRSTLDKRFCRPLKWKSDDIGEPKSSSPMNKLCLTIMQLTAIEEAIRWRDSEQWFRDKGVPWKRGWLLEGPPGTGKTAFTRALGQELNMPIISFDLATMTNQDFISAWEESMSRTPCITLFEDIDAVFNGRENVATKGSMNSGLSFDCLLNTLDGVQNTDGCFIIVTTNCINQVDPAIGVPTNGDDVSSRPGRIDRVINFVPLSTEGKEKMAERILGGFPEKEWKHLIVESKERTGAQFQDMCSRLALKLFWESKKDQTI